MKTSLTILLLSLAIATSAKNVYPENESTNTGSISYPTEALSTHQEGVVLISFEVEDGAPKNIQIVQSVCESLDNAAIELLNEKSSSFFEELENKEKKEFLLPVSFQIR